MRELAVFYCPKCGYYAYYQTSRHPQCPRCCHPDVMHMARMYYKEFMDMGCRERDDYLAQEIMKDNPSFLKRINAPHKRFNSREIIAEMNIEIMRLDIFEKRHIADHVKEVGAYLYEKLEGLKDKYDVVKDHRGVGLIQGLEFTVPVGPIVSKALLEQKLVLISAGANIIRFVPPLIIEKSDVDEMVKRLEVVIKEM